MQLAALRLFVHDLTRARQFYQSTLGLTLSVDAAAQGFCVFRSGAIDLIVESVPPDAPEDEQVLVGRFSGISFAVPDVSAAWQALRAKGVHFSGAPETQAWGGRLATLEDPAGNQMQIVQYPQPGA